jgi:hypothetical protein
VVDNSVDVLWLQLGDSELVWAEINGKGSMGRRRQQGFDAGIVMAGGRATRAWVLSFSSFFILLCPWW